VSERWRRRWRPEKLPENRDTMRGLLKDALPKKKVRSISRVKREFWRNPSHWLRLYHKRSPISGGNYCDGGVHFCRSTKYRRQGFEPEKICAVPKCRRAAKSIRPGHSAALGFFEAVKRRERHLFGAVALPAGFPSGSEVCVPVRMSSTDLKKMRGHRLAKVRRATMPGRPPRVIDPRSPNLR